MPRNYCIRYRVNRKADSGQLAIEVLPLAIDVRLFLKDEFLRECNRVRVFEPKVSNESLFPEFRRVDFANVLKQDFFLAHAFII